MPVFCIYKNKKKKYKKIFTGCVGSKFPTDDCIADLFLGDSGLLLYCSEYRTRSRNSTTVLPYYLLDLS